MFVNQTWPEVEATHLNVMFQGPKQAFLMRHESTEANQTRYETFFKDAGMKELFADLEEGEKGQGAPSLREWSDTFFHVIDPDEV